MKNLIRTLLVVAIVGLNFSALLSQRLSEESPDFEKTEPGIEIKANPIGLLFEVLLAEIEYQPWENASVALDLGIGTFDGLGYLNLRHKYYFNTKRGWDRFCLISQITMADLDSDIEGLGVGFGGGYKVLSKQNVLFDINFTVSRVFDGDIFPLGNFLVGYRF